MTHLGEVVIDGLKVSVDLRWPRPVLRALYGGMFEIAERRASHALLRKGDRVLELGTAIGLVAMTAARVVGAGNVTTYEANPNLIPLARRSAAANELVIDFRHGAVVSNTTAQGGRAHFFRMENFSASSTVQLPEASEPIEVPAVGISSVLTETHPDALVIDVEGGEAALVEAVARSNATRIILEVHPQVLGLTTCAGIGEHLVRAGFRLFELFCEGQVLCFVRDGASSAPFTESAAFAVIEALTFDPGSPEAIARLHEALRRNSDVPFARARLARALLQADEIGLAAEHARALVSTAPDRYEGHLLLARAERRGGHLDAARESVSRCLKVGSEIAEVWRVAYDIYMALGDRAAAFEATSHCVALDPLDSVGWLRHGRLALGLKQFEKARESAARAIALNSDDKKILDLQRRITDRLGIHNQH